MYIYWVWFILCVFTVIIFCDCSNHTISHDYLIISQFFHFNSFCNSLKLFKFCWLFESSSYKLPVLAKHRTGREAIISHHTYKLWWHLRCSTPLSYPQLPVCLWVCSYAQNSWRDGLYEKVKRQPTKTNSGSLPKDFLLNMKHTPQTTSYFYQHYKHFPTTANNADCCFTCLFNVLLSW